MSLSTTSPGLLNTSRDGDSITCLGSLFQYLTVQEGSLLLYFSVLAYIFLRNYKVPWNTQNEQLIKVSTLIRDAEFSKWEIF